MSFAASTAPGSKQQFVASKRYGRLKKMITPKTRQWGNETEPDSKKKFQPSKPNLSSNSNHDSQKQGSVSHTRAGEKTKDIQGTILPQTENEKKAIRRHKHKHDNEKVLGPRKGDAEEANEIGTIGGKLVGNNIYIMSVKKYKEIQSQRKHYEQRIEQLETDLKEVLSFYENLYKENEVLKQKLNVDNQVVAEPYTTVLNDRDILRTAEVSYKKRISQLDKELKLKTKENSAIKLEIKELKLENKKLYDDIKRLVGQLSDKNATKQTVEAETNDKYWENKPYKSEVRWLMEKKLKTKQHK